MLTENPQRQLKTLSRSKDPEFHSYLEGTFSNTELAIPVRSLNVGTQSEEVTFSIVPEESVDRPPVLIVARTLVRPSTWIFSAGPMLVVLAKTASTGYPIDWFVTLATIVGVFAFHAAVNLFNDYGDHMKGQDRVRPHGGSRAIQKGWIRAARVRQTAWGLLGFAILCGIPVVVSSPVAIIAGLALLAALEFAFQRIRLKARGLSEIVAFALTGPLLTVGFAWATVGRVTWSDATLGCIFGSIALMY
ncbi:MAG: prenyltransferase, partial [Bdellovibrionota bacterium]